MTERERETDREGNRQTERSSVSVYSQWAGPPFTFSPLFDVMKGESV